MASIRASRTADEGGAAAVGATDDDGGGGGGGGGRKWMTWHRAPVIGIGLARGVPSIIHFFSFIPGCLIIDHSVHN